MENVYQRKKGLDTGLSFIPFEETIKNVYQWEKARPDSIRKAGISREKEQALLYVWFQKEKKRTLLWDTIRSIIRGLNFNLKLQGTSFQLSIPESILIVKIEETKQALSFVKWF